MSSKYTHLPPQSMHTSVLVKARKVIFKVQKRRRQGWKKGDGKNEKGKDLGLGGDKLSGTTLYYVIAAVYM